MCVPFSGHVEHILLCVCHAKKCFEWGGIQKSVTRILYSVVFLPESYDFRNTQRGVNVRELLYLACVSELSDCKFSRCLHDCETWCVTFKEECRLRLLENNVLRKIFGLKKDSIRENWRTLYSEELHVL